MKVEEFIDPYLGLSWQQLGARVLSSGNRISVTLGYPAMGMQEQLQQQAKASSSSSKLQQQQEQQAATASSNS